MIVEYWVLNEKFSLDVPDETILSGGEETMDEAMAGIELLISEDMSERVLPKLIVTDTLLERIKQLLAEQNEEDEEDEEDDE